MINFVSYVTSKITSKFLLPGSISGILGRELLIKNLLLDTNYKEGHFTTGVKTVINAAIRASSVAVSPYNFLSLPYVTALANPILAVGKGYRAYSLYTQGNRQNDPEKIRQAKQKTVEVAAHVALAVFDYWTLGLMDNANIFNVMGIAYTIGGTVMDIGRYCAQKPVDHRRLKAEGYPDAYDESSVESTNEDSVFFASDTSSESDSYAAFAGIDSRRQHEYVERDRGGAAPAWLGEVEVEEEYIGYEYDSDRDAPSDALSSEEEARDDYPSERRISGASPIGAREARYAQETEQDPRQQDDCDNDRATIGGMLLRSVRVLRKKLPYTPLR